MKEGKAWEKNVDGKEGMGWEKGGSGWEGMACRKEEVDGKTSEKTRGENKKEN